MVLINHIDGLDRRDDSLHCFKIHAFTRYIRGVLILFQNIQKTFRLSLRIIYPGSGISLGHFSHFLSIATGPGYFLVIDLFRLIHQSLHVLICFVDFIEGRFNRIRRVDILELHRTDGHSRMQVVELGLDLSFDGCSQNLTITENKVKIHIADDPPGYTFGDIPDGLFYVFYLKEIIHWILDLILDYPCDINNVFVCRQHQ